MEGPQMTDDSGNHAFLTNHDIMVLAQFSEPVTVIPTAVPNTRVDKAE